VGTDAQKAFYPSLRAIRIDLIQKKDPFSKAERVFFSTINHCQGLVDVSDKILVDIKDAAGKFKFIEEKPFEGSDEDFYKVFRNYNPLEY